MPLIQVKPIENAFTTQQKQEVGKGIGGQPLSTGGRKRWQMADFDWSLGFNARTE